MHCPIIVGGGGGSGTRVVAEILSTCGVDIGNDLNPASDNLSFTYLFRRPQWYRKTMSDLHQRSIAMGLMHDISVGSYKNRPGQKSLLVTAGWEHTRNHPGLSFPRSGLWSLKRHHSIVSKKGSGQAWGWKEPNSHIYLPELVSYFPEMKYIHVVRNGLDMAFSDNQLQLQNWHWLFGIEKRNIRLAPQQASLKYWVESNLRTLDLSKRLPHENFMLLRFEALCAQPLDVVTALFNFLGIPPDDSLVAKCVALVKSPDTIGRYRDARIDAFDSEDIDVVRDLGFEVEY